ncbi:MAG: DoxX family protein [Propionibacteriaceae bacterium]|nr:DoxX family protein [Propionibacteriaceae bacterium]
MSDVDVGAHNKPRMWISLVARLILGGALLIAGLLSITDLSQSLRAVQAYQLPFPDALVTVIGYGLPVLEILVGVVIIAGLFTRWTALLGGLMMVIYIAGITSAWVRGLSIDCGCFTPGGFLEPGESTKYLQDILRDLGFALCAIWLIIFPQSRFSLDSWIDSDTTIADSKAD